MVEIIENIEVRVKYTPVFPETGHNRFNRRTFRADLFIKAKKADNHTVVTLVTSGGTAMGQTDSPFYTIRCKDEPKEIILAAMKGKQRYWNLMMK